MTNTDHWVLREKLVSTLEADCKINYERIQPDPNDLNRRNYIRSLFALYEAIFSNMRESLADRIISKQINSDLNLHEVYPLIDESAFVNEQGGISKKPNQIPFRSMVKYVLKLTCQEHQIKEDIFTGGWNDFITSISIRHRITHPKYENEISVTDQDLKTIENGRKWLNDTLRVIRNSRV